MLVFIEEDYDFFNWENRSTSLVGLNPSNGEETWRYVIPGAYHATMNARYSTLYVRYELAEPVGADEVFKDGEKSEVLWGRLMQIGAGADGPTKVVEVDVSGSNPDLVHSGGIIFLLEGHRLSAFSMTIDRLWTFPADGSDLDAQYDSTLFQNMVSDGAQLFVTQGEGRVFSLDRSGQLKWDRRFADVDCLNVLRLALHPEVLIVGGTCDESLVGLDRTTGETLWQTETLPPVDAESPVVSGDTFYWLGNTGDGTLQTNLMAYNALTGVLLQERTGFTQEGGFIRPRAAANGHLFGYSTHFESDQGRIIAYESEPAQLGVSLMSVDPPSCGIPAELPITLLVNVANLGPGLAPNTRLRLSSHAGGEFIVPGHLGNVPSGPSVTIELGDLEALSLEALEIDFRPDKAGEFQLVAQVLSDVRNPELGKDIFSFVATPPVPSDLDLSIDWVEVTQGLQDGNNSIGLIAGKPTLLRVYASSNATIDNVKARMRITGSAGSSGTVFNELVVPLEDCLTLTAAGSSREEMATSFNFLVPPDMLSGIPSGAFSVEIQLDPGDLFNEANRENSRYMTELNFEELPPICFMTHRVLHKAMGGGETIGSEFYPIDHIARAVSMLPTREILQFSSGNILKKLTVTGWGPYELDPGGEQETTRILNTLWMHYHTSWDPFICNSRGAITIRAGVVAENNLTTHPTGNFNGVAILDGNQQVNRVRGGGAVTNAPAGGTTLAHETGHSFNRQHVNCGSPSDPDPLYPYDNCEMGPLGHLAFYGTDLMNPRKPIVVAPRPAGSGTELGDLLSYAGERWTSDYTWKAMRSYMLANMKHMENRKSGEGIAFLQDEAQRDWLSSWKGTEGKNILITGTMKEDGTTTLDDILPFSPAVVPKEKALALVAKNFEAMKKSTSHAVELLDSNGVLILSVPVVPQLLADADPIVYTIGIIVPMPDGLAEIRLLDELGVILASSERSNAAPGVEITGPVAGEAVDDMLLVEWTATDADNDALTTLVQYSPDNGANWTTLTANAPESPQLFEAGLLPGGIGTARVRIIVSDGFNATEAESGSFTVAPGAPIASLTQPVQDQVFQLGEPIFVVGAAYDPEDGPLMDESLAWEVEGVGVVGTGGSLILGGLSAGTHRLMLIATDSDGEAGAAEVTFTVLPRRATQSEISAMLIGVLEKSEDSLFDVNEDSTIDSADVPEIEP